MGTEVEHMWGAFGIAVQDQYGIIWFTCSNMTYYYIPQWFSLYFTIIGNRLVNSGTGRLNPHPHSHLLTHTHTPTHKQEVYNNRVIDLVQELMMALSLVRGPRKLGPHSPVIRPYHN